MKSFGFWNHQNKYTCYLLDQIFPRIINSLHGLFYIKQMKQLSCFKWHSSVGTVHYVKWSKYTCYLLDNIKSHNEPILIGNYLRKLVGQYRNQWDFRYSLASHWRCHITNGHNQFWLNQLFYQLYRLTRWHQKVKIIRRKSKYYSFLNVKYSQE
jgi:hypothetical protein